MRIRMTDDPNQPNDNFGDGGGGRRPNNPGGGGGLGTLLSLLLGLFKGKGIIVLLALVAGAHFLLGRGGGGCNLEQIISLFSQSGYSFNLNEFNKASVYEELDENNPGNAIPVAFFIKICT